MAVTVTRETSGQTVNLPGIALRWFKSIHLHHLAVLVFNSLSGLERRRSHAGCSSRCRRSVRRTTVTRANSRMVCAAATPGPAGGSMVPLAGRRRRHSEGRTRSRVSVSTMSSSKVVRAFRARSPVGLVLSLEETAGPEPRSCSPTRCRRGEASVHRRALVW